MSELSILVGSSGSSPHSKHCNQRPLKIAEAFMNNVNILDVLSKCLSPET